jgi:hypothetical protein
MNIETRTFIFGLIILFVCGFGVGINVLQFIRGTFGGGWHWVTLIFSLLGAIIGSIKIAKTTL